MRRPINRIYNSGPSPVYAAGTAEYANQGMPNDLHPSAPPMAAPVTPFRQSLDRQRMLQDMRAKVFATAMNASSPAQQNVRQQGESPTGIPGGQVTVQRTPEGGYAVSSPQTAAGEMLHDRERQAGRQAYLESKTAEMEMNPAYQQLAGFRGQMGMMEAAMRPSPVEAAKARALDAYSAGQLAKGQAEVTRAGADAKAKEAWGNVQPSVAQGNIERNQHVEQLEALKANHADLQKRYDEMARKYAAMEKQLAGFAKPGKTQAQIDDESAANVELKKAQAKHAAAAGKYGWLQPGAE